MTEYTPMTNEVLREKIAATVAVNDLLHSRKTWGDLLPVQKKYYLGVSDALLPIIAEVRTAALEEAAGIADQVWTSAQQHGFDGVTEAAVSEIIAERIRAAKDGAQ